MPYFKLFFLTFTAFLMITPLSAQEGTVPSKLYVSPFTVSGAGLPASHGVIFQEKVKSIVSLSSNQLLIQDYQITNYSDQSDPMKYLLINKIHGMINGELRKNGKQLTLLLNMTGRTGKNDCFTNDFLTIDEGLSNLDQFLPAFLDGRFPRIPKSVSIQEEVEKVGVGKFEYIRPAWIMEAGGVYNSLTFTQNGKHSINWYGGYFDSSFRYSWWGLNFGGSYCNENSFTAYAGPELNLLKGLLILTARAEYLSFNHINDGNLYYQYSGLSGQLMFTINVTENYSISAGVLFTPNPSLSRLSYTFSDIDTNNISIPASVTNVSGHRNGCFIKVTFRITKRLKLNLLYQLDVGMSSQIGSDAPFSVGSGLQIGISHAFQFGGN